MNDFTDFYIFFFHHKNFESSNLLFRYYVDQGHFVWKSLFFGLIETLQTKLVISF